MIKHTIITFISVFMISASVQAEDQLDDVSKSLFTVQLEQAKKGDSQDQFFVGEMYEKGLGTPKNLSEAKSWYQKSANQGFKEAIKKLAKWEEQRQAEARAKQLAEQRAVQQQEQAEQQRQAEERKKAAVAAEAKKQSAAKAAAAKPPTPAKPAAAKPKPVEAKPAPAPVVADKEKKADTDKKEDVGFSSNPCKGPTAKFLTTCKDK
ncbi:MAG: hypothetical protein OEY67_09810 [Gammaproteobacteria bacterium]|nr:hypothetical protein [Gammaproteobacteria bacterium]